MGITTPTTNVPATPKVKNLATYSLQEKGVSKGSETYTEFASKKKLSSFQSSGERRAPDYTLEQMAKTGSK